MSSREPFTTSTATEAFSRDRVASSTALGGDLRRLAGSREPSDALEDHSGAHKSPNAITDIRYHGLVPLSATTSELLARSGE